MLDERDKLMDSLREAQERLNEMEGKLGDCEKERDSLHRQINANLPQVIANIPLNLCDFFSSCSITILMNFRSDRFGLVGIESFRHAFGTDLVFCTLLVKQQKDNFLQINFN